MVRSIVAMLLALLSSTSVFAGSAETINYQGLLLAPDGSPMNGAVEIITRIWDAPTAGTIQWSELHSGVPVVDGVFSIALGEQNTALPSVLDGRDLWLEI